MAAVTRWLTDDEQRAWRAFVAMRKQLDTALNRQLQADSDLSLADFEVLVSLTDRPGDRARAYELARDLQWEKSRLSHHLARMRGRGLVAREGCPEDARGSFVSLTERGREAIEQAAPGHVETVRKLLLDHLDAEQVEALREISEGVLQRLE
jgi:DNA-binding MarR family transcriptional regulator